MRSTRRYPVSVTIKAMRGRSYEFGLDLPFPGLASTVIAKPREVLFRRLDVDDVVGAPIRVVVGSALEERSPVDADGPGFCVDVGDLAGNPVSRTTWPDIDKASRLRRVSPTR